jgi:hypothetical protein
MNTLYLVPNSWDLTVDSSGNIAMATEPYALAQDAASAAKTFLGEAYYNTLLGVAYEWKILGENPPLEYIRQQLIKAALTVPDVIAARVFFTGFANRVLTGQIQVTNSQNIVTALNF